jgi:hypothetical protein
VSSMSVRMPRGDAGGVQRDSGWRVVGTVVKMQKAAPGRLGKVVAADGRRCARARTDNILLPGEFDDGLVELVGAVLGVVERRAVRSILRMAFKQRSVRSVSLALSGVPIPYQRGRVMVQPSERNLETLPSQRKHCQGAASGCTTGWPGMRDRRSGSIDG